MDDRIPVTYSHTKNMLLFAMSRFVRNENKLLYCTL